MDFEVLEDSLLGEDHRSITRTILEDLDSLSTGDEATPRLHVLEGWQGVGKTYIIQTIYNTLATIRNSTHYWPHLTAPAAVNPPERESPESPFVRRHATGPDLKDFAWRPGSLPEFTWWNLKGSHLTNEFHSAGIDQCRNLLEVHLAPAAFASRHAGARNALTKGNISSIQSKLRSLGGTLATDGSIEAIERLLGTPLPGAGLLFNAAFQTVQHFQDRAKQQLDSQNYVATGTAAAFEQDAYVTAVAESIKSVATPELPAIVVIDDAHQIDESLASLTSRLIQRDARHPVLVILAARRPVDNKKNLAYVQLKNWPTVTKNIRIHEVPSLTPSDLGILANRFAPGTDAETINKLTSRYNTPLTLLTYLSLDRTKQIIRRNSGRLVISDRELEELPEGIADLFRAHINEWDPTLVRSLAFTAATMSRSWPDRPFLEDIVTAVADHHENPGRDVVTDQLAIARSTNLLRPDSSKLNLFSDPLLFRTLRARIQTSEQNEISEQTIQTLRNSISTSSQPANASKEPLGPFLLRCHWLISLQDHPSTFEDSTAYFSAAIDAGNRNRFSLAISLATLGATSSEVDDHLESLTDRLLGRWYGKIGNYSAAVETLTRQIGSAIKAEEPTVDILRLKSDRAHWRAESGDLAGSIVEFQEIMQLLADHPEIDLLTKIKLYHDYSMFLARAGDYDRAIDILQPCLGQVDDLADQYPSDVLKLRCTLAGFYGQAGRADVGLCLMRSLIESLGSITEDHPMDLITVLRTQSELLHTVGQVNRALDLRRHVHALQTRYLEHSDPDILSSRAAIAKMTGESGDPARAVELFLAIAAEQKCRSGESSPSRLASLHSIAHFTALGGDLISAREQFNELVPLECANLGATHEITLASRLMEAYWLVEAGSRAEARTKLEKLLPDLRSTHGPKHPRSITAEDIERRAVSREG